MKVNAMGNDFGVRLGREGVPKLGELIAQFIMILDDAVMHDGDPVERNVRMGVALGRHTVGCPTGMRNTEMTFCRTRRECLLEHLHFTDSAKSLELLTAIEHGHAGGVVATVFEA